MVPYTDKLFIFDMVTLIPILLAIIVMYVKTRKLWSLSLQKGIKYLNNAILMYFIGFSARLISAILDYNTDHVFNNFHLTYLGIFLVLVNLFASLLGGLYLGYSLIWRLFEKDRIKRFHPLRVLIVGLLAFVISCIDIFLMIQYNVTVPYLFFAVNISFLVYAITVNCTVCHKKKQGDYNPFISMVGLGLGVYIVYFLENIFIKQLFTIHYYGSMVVLVFTLAFMYHILKIAR